MEIDKKTTTLVVKTLDSVYKITSAKSLEDSEFAKAVPDIANIFIKLYSLYRDNPNFMPLFEQVKQLLSAIASADNEIVPGTAACEMMRTGRDKLLVLLEEFELSLFAHARFHIYLYNCKAADIPLNCKYLECVEELPEFSETLKSLPSQENGADDFSVLIYAGKPQNTEMLNADFCFQAEDICNTVNAEVQNIDYYMHDRLYLESKLDSLKSRQDIRLLLAGSSYSMCGLFEEQMPLPARNVAIDAQDLYYTLKTIRTALAYDKNITHCIISFAYYFWGYDLSLSTSVYQYKRITEVNYPVFKDKHNLPEELDVKGKKFLTSVTPLKKQLFSFEMQLEQYLGSIKKGFVDSHYFAFPRLDSMVLKFDDATNRENAQKRTSSHNKFFKYGSTVKENKKLFADFLEEMNHRGVQIILYVPPVTKYYRSSHNSQLIADYYECMKPFQEKYNFKLIDLFDSNVFKDGDFADYDHLNDKGAKKLGEILAGELDL